ATAAGQQADADFHQSAVKLGVRLTRCGMQSHLTASAERHAKWPNYNRFRRKLNSLCHVLELPDSEVNLVPFFFLDRHQQHHDVGADGEIRGVVGDDEGVKVVARATGLKRLHDHLNDVAAQRVHLGVEL